MNDNHKNICREIKLEYHKPNDIIFKQGEYGDCFFYILNGTVKVLVSKVIDLGDNSEQNGQIFEVNIFI